MDPNILLENYSKVFPRKETKGLGLLVVLSTRDLEIALQCGVRDVVAIAGARTLEEPISQEQADLIASSVEHGSIVYILFHDSPLGNRFAHEAFGRIPRQNPLQQIRRIRVGEDGYVSTALGSLPALMYPDKHPDLILAQ